jgi:hypothetical protein
LKPHEIFINDVKDENVQFWSYNQGDNRFIDNAIILIPDNDRSLFLTDPNYNASNYLYKDVKIKNDFDEVGEYIVFRGRINAPPSWQEGFVVITVEGYLAQYKDRLLGEYITVEDIQTGEFTGYITGFPSSSEIQDSGKGWGNDDYNNNYCLIHTPLSIPSTEWFLGVDWLATKVRTQIYASADDAHFNTGTSVWDNDAAQTKIDSSNNGYLRFGINIPNNATITSCRILYLQDTLAATAMDLYLLDVDDCLAFPDGAGNENEYPEDDGTPGYPKKISFTSTVFPGWKSKDITSHLQAFIDRDGYLPGQYMGIKIESTTVLANLWDAFDVGVGAGGNPPILDIVFTYTAPTDIDFIINDTTAPDTLDLTSFDAKLGFIVGHPYSISKLTSDIVEFMVDTYSLDEAVSKDIETSTIGMIKKFVWGNNALDVMNACFNTDNFRMRLKNDLEFMYRQFSTIANAGTIPEEIIDQKYRATNPPSMMFNIVKMKDVYGRLVVRGWNYTTHAPQDDVVTALPADYPQRELFVPGVRWGGTIVCKSILDTYLYLYAEPESEENISVELNQDLEFQPGQIVDLPFRGDTYSDYYITRKSYNEATQRATLRLVGT